LQTPLTCYLRSSPRKRGPRLKLYARPLDSRFRGNERSKVERVAERQRGNIHRIVLDFNPIRIYSHAVLFIEGRHLEASDGGAGCGARGRALARHAPGRRRGSAWRPIRAARQELADGWPSAFPRLLQSGAGNGGKPMKPTASQERRSAKSAARRSKEDAVMARREAPRVFEREHGH